MTLEELITRLSQADSRILLAAFAVPPLLSFLISRFHSAAAGNSRPFNFLYSLLVFSVCVPGMCALVLTVYTLFFLRQNLLQVNVTVYFLPVIAMIATLVLISKKADLNRLPGVDRLYALMIFLTVSFAVALAIQKTRIWIFFGGSIKFLILIALFCFALLKWGSYMLFRQKNQPRKSRPKFGSSSHSRSTGSDSDDELDRLKRRMGIHD